jgi:hypothetical protein
MAHDIRKTGWEVTELKATGNGDLDGWHIKCDECGHYFTTSIKAGMEQDMIHHITFMQERNR